MKKIFTYFGIILLFLIIPAALSFVPIGNNIILLKYNNDLERVILNADYKVLARDSKCGKLIGNGNGMQYFSALLIQSEETLKWENNDFEGVFLIDITDDSFSDLIGDYNLDEHNSDFMKKLKEIENPDNYYVIYSFYCADLNSIWNSDLRAH